MRRLIVLTALCASFLATYTRSYAVDNIQVDIHLKSTVVASFEGIGVQWDPYEYPPSAEMWKLTLDRLDRCKPGYFRICHNAGDYFQGFGADGVPRYVWDTQPAPGQQQSHALGQLYALLDYAQSRKINVILGEWSPPWMDGKRIGAEDPRWARIVADCLRHLIRDKHYSVIRYFNYVNEPNGDWSGNKSYASWQSGIENLHKQLQDRGLDREVAIVGPDTTGNTDWLEPFTWLDRVAKQIPDAIGAYDLHWYAQDKEVLQGAMEPLLRQKRQMALATDPNAKTKRMFLGESGLITGRVNGDQQPRVRTFEYGVMMADYVAQVARAGWMGVVAWDCDDAMHTNDKHIPIPDDRTLKLWGFWNTQGDVMGKHDETRPRPWFYTWTLMSRLFPHGCRIVQADADSANRFRALAATDASGKQLSLMLVNNADTARSVTVRATGAGVRTWSSYHYFEDDRPSGRDGAPVAAPAIERADCDKGFTVQLPARGVVFLTTQSLRL